MLLVHCLFDFGWPLETANINLFDKLIAQCFQDMFSLLKLRHPIYFSEFNFVGPVCSILKPFDGEGPNISFAILKSSDETCTF